MPQETSPKLRRVVALSHRMLLGALLCFALWGSSPSAVYATTPVAAPSEPALTQGMPGEGAAMAEPPGLGLYLMALGVALLMMGFYVLQRARQRRLLDFEVMPDEPLPLAPTQLLTPKHDELTALVQAVAHEKGSSHELAIRIIEDRPLFAPRGDSLQRECPKCQRHYASWVTVCPVDASPLREIMPRRKAARPARGQTVLPRKRCPGCERRFEEGASVCPYDRTPLSKDTMEAAILAQPRTVCRGCGHDLEHEEDASCQCGEACDPITLRPHSEERKAPAMPLTVCPSCRAYGGFGKIHCANDGELLIPVTSIEANALPASGYGTRRKLCRKCGTRYSGAYIFCAHDGARLTPIN